MVICDTNIWYWLGDGRIKPSEFGENELVVTGVTVEELCTSEMIFSDSKSFKSAIRAINKYATQFIEYDPIEYILSQISPDFKPNRLHYINMMDSLQLCLQTELENNEKRIDELKKSIKEWNTPHLNLVKTLNNNLAKVRNHTKQVYTKKEFRQLDTVPEIVSMFNEIFKVRIKNSDTIKFENIDWENFELLLFIWDDYFKEKILQNNSKFHLNDIYDLLNMAYVQKKNKYWTKEKNPWNRLIAANEYTKKYLFKEGEPLRN